MIEQITQKPEPTLEEVKIHFETWRKIKKGRQPIPDQLWQAAFNLSKKHSFYKIAKTLRLDYTKLKRFNRQIQNDPMVLKDLAPAFIELGLKTHASACECVFDMKAADGTQMKMHFRADRYVDPVELCRVFWSKR